MQFQNIKFAIEDRVVRITFNRPPLNIFNIAMMREIGAALNECANQNDLVAIVFAANKGSRAFSAGVSVEEHVPETVVEMLDSFHDIFRKLNQISKPAIAVVDGAALGGGCELVLACDIVIVSERATFGQPEIKLGVFPPVAAILLPRIVGDKKAREMILTGETIDATQALCLGLVNHVVAAAEVETHLKKVLINLRGLSAAALGLTEKAMRIASDNFDARLRNIEDLYLDELMNTHDANEGLEAFMQKRLPKWQHR